MCFSVDGHVMMAVFKVSLCLDKLYSSCFVNILVCFSGKSIVSAEDLITLIYCSLAFCIFSQKKCLTKVSGSFKKSILMERRSILALFRPIR